MSIIYYPLYTNKSRNNWLDWFDSLLDRFEYLPSKVLELMQQSMQQQSFLIQAVRHLINLTLFRMGGKKASLLVLPISPKIFLTFSFNCFATLV